MSSRGCGAATTSSPRPSDVVDEVRVLRLLRSISDDLAVLRSEASANPERRADPLWLRGVKYTFVTAIEAGVDVAQHVCASEGWGPPRDNGDAIRLLGAHGVLSVDLADRLRRAVGSATCSYMTTSRSMMASSSNGSPISRTLTTLSPLSQPGWCHRVTDGSVRDRYPQRAATGSQSMSLPTAAPTAAPATEPQSDQFNQPVKQYSLPRMADVCLPVSRIVVDLVVMVSQVASGFLLTSGTSQTQATLLSKTGSY
jgi:uncharacterized protein YutE (UPF0331/DUF86 family)